jgi:hypothetical protein
MKMVQLDALSRQPDYGTKEQFDDEERTMVPENLFINLLDTELQERIVNGNEIDLDVKNTMETLLEEGPANLQNDLHNWQVEKIIFQKIRNYNEIL